MNLREADQVQIPSQQYREAVKANSPGLLRFAATLGKGVAKDSNPNRGCVGFWRNPVGVDVVS